MLFVTLLVGLGVATCGCAGYIHDSSANATQSAIDTATSDANKKKLGDLGASAAGAARDAALDPAAVSPKMAAIRDAFLPPLQLQLAGMVEGLRPKAVALVDGALVPMDAHVAAWREILVGQPLRDDVHQLVEQEGPHLGAIAGKAAGDAVTQALGAARVQVNAEATTARGWLIDIAAILAIAIGAIAFALFEIRAHRKLLAAIAARN